ncbi:disease resistance protein RPS2 [Vigna unguiculata]|uniref:Disease resistance protein RPS2 n=1 Tax=Vigna unguiculata TaxID=3917 RepID=A0A4D6MRS8_VIGUN|nr:disease resistance protein RPS2 [Vigna unguiculata]
MLVHLEELCIVQCGSMEEILAKDQSETASEGIRFERLSTVILDSLSRLSCFYSGNGTLHLSSLIRLLIWKCPSMKIFSKGDIDAQSFMGIQVSLDPEEDLLFHQDLNTTVNQMFEHGEFLEAVDEECFSDNLQLQSYWHGKVGLQNKWLCNLGTLKLHNCTLPYAIPSSILPYLNNLRELEVLDSDKVEVIFYMDDNNIMEAPSPLKILTLKWLSELTHIWKNNSQEVLSFPNLQEIVVSGCEKLKSLLPASLAKGLEKFEKLEVESCYELQEIVAKEVDTSANVAEKFVFPSLKKLDLCDLPHLTYFHTFTLQSPTLNELSVLDCHELELFQSAHHTGEIEDTSAPTNPQPLISNLKAISNLKKLRLDWKHISASSLRFRSEKFAEGLNCLEKITLFFDAEENEKAMLPIEMLQMAPNLIEMSINCCSDTGIFIAQHPEISGKGMLGQLKILTLSEVSVLQSIESDHPSWLNIICEKLHELNVSECPDLRTLVHSTSAVSFSDLKEVFISKCLDLQYLLTSSVAKRLMNLEKITVKECKSLREIVAKEGDETSEGIMKFDLLNTIALESLPSLICFYSGSDTLLLPSLINVHTRECANMKYFSRGAIGAKFFPEIQMSLYPHEDFLLLEDLNATVMQANEDFLSLQDLNATEKGVSQAQVRISLGINY